MALLILIKLMMLTIYNDTYLLQINAASEIHRHLWVTPIANITLKIYIKYWMKMRYSKVHDLSMRQWVENFMSSSIVELEMRGVYL